MVFGIIPECRSDSFRIQRSASPESPRHRKYFDGNKHRRSYRKPKQGTAGQCHRDAGDMDGKLAEYLFRRPLKVSGQRRYDAAMPPQSSIIFDILMDGTCATGAATKAGVFLVSALDLAP